MVILVPKPCTYDLNASWTAYVTGKLNRIKTRKVWNWGFPCTTLKLEPPTATSLSQGFPNSVHSLCRWARSTAVLTIQTQQRKSSGAPGSSLPPSLSTLFSSPGSFFPSYLYGQASSHISGLKNHVHQEPLFPTAIRSASSHLGMLLLSFWPPTPVLTSFILRVI